MTIQEKIKTNSPDTFFVQPKMTITITSELNRFSNYNKTKNISSGNAHLISSMQSV